MALQSSRRLPLSLCVAAAMSAGGSFRSLVCTFSGWYNWSRAGEPRNSSGVPLERFATAWQVFQPPRHMGVLQLCPLACLLVAAPAACAVLLCVLRARPFRLQTRYLLLSSMLAADLAFLACFSLNDAVTAAGGLTSQLGCASLLSLLGTLHCASVLSATGAAGDAALAVLWPLRYRAVWPVSRTRRALLAAWAAALLFPAAAVGSFMRLHQSGPCDEHICSLPLLLVLTVGRSAPLRACALLTTAAILAALLLVFCGYLALCCGTGPWRARSRARGTFLIHYLHLFLSFLPVLAMVVELVLFSRRGAPDRLRLQLWGSMVVCNVLLLLPKVLAPYLYGLRYRDVRRALLGLLRLRRPVPIAPVV